MLSLDRLASELDRAVTPQTRTAALLAQIDLIPDRPDAGDPSQWDALGQPR